MYRVNSAINFYKQKFLGNKLNFSDKTRIERYDYDLLSVAKELLLPPKEKQTDKKEQPKDLKIVPPIWLLPPSYPYYPSRSNKEDH
jgi:hypothetical protein